MQTKRKRIQRIDLESTQSILKNDLSFAVQYADEKNTYQDILHHSEICFEGMPYRVIKIIAISKHDKPVLEAVGLEAYNILKRLSNYNKHKTS